MRRSRTWRGAEAVKATKTSSKNSWPGCAQHECTTSKSLRARPARLAASVPAVSCCSRESASRERPEEDTHPLHLGDRRPRTEHIIVLPLDLFQDLQASPAEQLEVDRETPVHLIRQRQPFQKQVPRHCDHVPHNAAKSIVELPGKQAVHRISVPADYVQRQINTILFQIDDYVLPEVRKLQSRARGIGERLTGGVAIPAKAEHQPSHRIRRAAAIFEQLLEIAIARHDLILLESFDQVIERSDRKLMPRRGSEQGDKHGMPRLSCVERLQLQAPPREQPQALRRVADLVRKIVRPAAVRVDVKKILM